MGKGYAESKDGMEKEGINISSFWKFALLFVVVDTIVVLMALLALVGKKFCSLCLLALTVI